MPELDTQVYLLTCEQCLSCHQLEYTVLMLRIVSPGHISPEGTEQMEWTEQTKHSLRPQRED